MLIRVYLALAALMFAAFGVYSLLAPVRMAAGLSVEIGGPNGAYEAAGVYGGVSLGAAMLTAAGAALMRYTRPALWFIAAYMGGYCIARAAACPLHGPPTAQYIPFIAFEAAMLAAAIVGLRARKA